MRQGNYEQTMHIFLQLQGEYNEISTVFKPSFPSSLHYTMQLFRMALQPLLP